MQMSVEHSLLSVCWNCAKHECYSPRIFFLILPELCLFHLAKLYFFSAQFDLKTSNYRYIPSVLQSLYQVILMGYALWHAHSTSSFRDPITWPFLACSSSFYSLFSPTKYTAFHFKKIFLFSQDIVCLMHLFLIEHLPWKELALKTTKLK